MLNSLIQAFIDGLRITTTIEKKTLQPLFNFNKNFEKENIDLSTKAITEEKAVIIPDNVEGKMPIDIKGELPFNFENNTQRKPDAFTYFDQFGHGKTHFESSVELLPEVAAEVAKSKINDLFNPDNICNVCGKTNIDNHKHSRKERIPDKVEINEVLQHDILETIGNPNLI